MRMKGRIDLKLLSVRSLRSPEDFLAVVRLQNEMLPEFTPQKFGWVEPTLSFDAVHPEQLIPSDCNGQADNVFWKRTGKNRAEGAWMPGWRQQHAGQMLSTHGSMSLAVFDSRSEQDLIAYLQAGSVQAGGDFGFVDGQTEAYRPHALLSDFTLFGTGLSVVTPLLRHWLPDMPWATVFGPAYVRMFGKERVLSAPVHLVKELGPETVYLQLTPKLEDIEERFDEVMTARERVKQHLGADAFFQPEKAYDWREHPEMAGKVFRVPEFQLLSD